MSVVLSSFIRFTHWGIATAVLANLYLTEEGELPHQILGYAAALLVVSRLIYGFTTKNHRHFPNKIAYFTYLGIWISIMALGVSGYLMGTETYWGNENLEEIHELLANTLQGLILIHLSGIALDAYLHKRKTWMNMIG